MLLALETSCDETAVSILDLEAFRTGHAAVDALRANVLATQAALHAPYGGVVPELAARTHTTNLPQLLQAVCDNANLKATDITACCVTSGPGLKGALLVAMNFAKGFSWSRSIPCIPVNHLEGHLWAAELERRDGAASEFLALLVSGGHTVLIQVEGFRRYRIIAETRDDAAGEAFDKIASIMELPYPGGPSLSKLAVDGDPQRFIFPRMMAGDPKSFSFSGLKTAALRKSEELRRNGSWDDPILRKDFAASVERAIVDSLLDKSLAAVKELQPKRFVISGGVAANRLLRREFEQQLSAQGVELLIPRPEFCTDNAAMIGVVGAMSLEHFGAEYFAEIPKDDARPRWPLTELSA